MIPTNRSGHVLPFPLVQNHHPPAPVSLWASFLQWFTLNTFSPCSQDDPSKVLCHHVSFRLRMFQQFPVACPAGSGAPRAPALTHLPSLFLPHCGPWNPQHIPASWLIIALVVHLSQMPFYSLPFAWLALTCPSGHSLESLPPGTSSSPSPKH